MRRTTTALTCLALAATMAAAEPVARVNGRLLDQSEIDEAFGTDPVAKDDLRSLAVASLAVVTAIAGDDATAKGVGLREAARFMSNIDKDATKHAAETLTDNDYRLAYEARRESNVPWAALGAEDKAAFQASLAARMGFRVACTTIAGAVTSAKVEWLDGKPESWGRKFGVPEACARSVGGR